jgi:5-methylcytosine-specific restriction endonuclease McrA
MEKALTEFSPDKRISSGLQSKCKKCFAEIVKMNRLQNPETTRASVKRSTEKHYAKKLERNNAYRKANPEKVKQWKKHDREENKARILSDNAMRRSMVKGETTSEIKQLYALRDFYKAMSLGDDFHVDHIIPLSKNGMHVIENLRVIPAIDNLRKGASLV